MNINIMRNDILPLGDKTLDGHGYILDEPYISRYFDLQSPSRMRYSALCAGFADFLPGKAFKYCELGCGNGLTAIVLAALYPDCEFVGIDLNPEHIENAAALASRCGLSNTRFIQADFVEAMNMDLPQFDYVTIHGVYSWVDLEIREQMMALTRKLLARTGIAYVSYNAMPGWAAKEPLWRLVNTYIHGREGSSTNRTRQGLDFLDFLSETNSPFFSQNPSSRDHLAFLKGEDLNYVSHEYCNDQLKPCYAADVFSHAARYGLTFLAQSESCYNIPFERVPSQYLDFIAGFKDDIERETWASLLRNDDFRTDLYSSVMPERQRLEDSPLWDMALTTIIPVRDLPRELECGSRVLLSGDDLISGMIAACEAGDKNLREMCNHPALQRFPRRLILETAQLLELSGHFAMMPAPVATGRPGDDRKWQFSLPGFRQLVRERLYDGDIIYAPCPALRTALMIGQMEAVALLACSGNNQDEAVAQFSKMLNEDFPELLRFEADADWASNYLADFRQNWGRLFVKLGTLCEA
ncbi:MAG: methyltransferase domain-containing protein [Nitratireductor sp.]|nr:methyltransferase domain-containing protein [Nitratireductor sp.]